MQYVLLGMWYFTAIRKIPLDRANKNPDIYFELMFRLNAAYFHNVAFCKAVWRNQERFLAVVNFDFGLTSPGDKKVATVLNLHKFIYKHWEHLSYKEVIKSIHFCLRNEDSLLVSAACLGFYHSSTPFVATTSFQVACVILPHFFIVSLLKVALPFLWNTPSTQKMDH